MKLDVMGSLTKKIGFQPAWAWLAEMVGGLYWWRHRAGAGAATSATSAYDPYAAAGGAGSSGSGAGGGFDSGSGSSGGGGFTGSGSGSGYTDPGQVSGVPSLTPGTVGDMPVDLGSADGTSAAAPGISAKTAAQTGGGLVWGGHTFKSQAEFKAYLKKKGLSVTQFARQHPDAYGIYGSLPAGQAAKHAKKTPPKRSVKRQAPRDRQTAKQATPHHTTPRGGDSPPSQGKSTRKRAATHHPAPKPTRKQSRTRAKPQHEAPAPPPGPGPSWPRRPRHPYQTPPAIIDTGAPPIHGKHAAKHHRRPRVVHYRGRH